MDFEGVVVAESPVLRLENRHTGEVLELRRGLLDGTAVLDLRGSLPPHRSGPPLHIHWCEDEEGTVTRGTLSVEVGGRRLDLGPGQTAQLPRGVPHRWWNDGDELLVFRGITSQRSTSIAISRRSSR